MQRRYLTAFVVTIGILLAAIVPRGALAQDPPPPRLPSRTEPYGLTMRAGALPESDARKEYVAFDEVIRSAGALWLRIHFAEFQLGAGSYVRLTGLKDGGQQRLYAADMANWSNFSAHFNGDAVRVELVVAPGDDDVSAQVDQLIVGERQAEPDTICGAIDDRVPSTERRVARLPATGCTAWPVANGTFLTAGHCVDLDPDQGGPMLPDGVVDLPAGAVVEFNVPASNADGSIVFADPNDQFPIDLTGIRWRFVGAGQGLGKDWAVFRVQRNVNTGAAPHVRQGFWRMTRENPTTIDNTIRIEGYGTDTTPATRNQTLQTHSGPYVSESSSGADIWHNYRADTMPANSGSPIIWLNNTIGIHTTGGCQATGTGSNSGTSFENDQLENAIHDFPGPNVVYVDMLGPGFPGNGRIFEPYRNLGEGIAAASPNATISIVSGFYVVPRIINKRVTLTAPVGTVYIR